MAKKSYFSREPIAQLEDLRDDCIAIVLNSRLSFQAVHARGGPTPQTTSKWLYKETKFPQLATVRAILNACDHEITIAPKGSSRIQRMAPEAVKMPPKQDFRKLRTLGAVAPAKPVSRLKARRLAK